MLSIITRESFLAFFKNKTRIVINNPHMKYTKLLLEKEKISYEVNEKDNTVESNIINADFSFFKPYNYELDMKNLKFKKTFLKYVVLYAWD